MPISISDRLRRCGQVLLLLAAGPAWALDVPPRLDAVWLQRHLGAEDLAIIEISGETSYLFDGHIPGSVFSTKSDWRRQADDGALVHLPVTRLTARLRELGVDDNDGVVIYYKGNDTDEILGAYYLFWLLHLLGHPNVGMLDGGWYAWRKAGGPVAEAETQIEPGDFVARPLLPLKVGTAELGRIFDRYLLVDGRPASHFAGVTKFAANPRKGRIPGSLNQPWQDYVRRAPDGRWYAMPPALPRLLREKPVPPETPILLTCLGGTGAAFNYAVFYAAGYHNLRVHDAGLRRWNLRHMPLINPTAETPGR